MKGDFLKIITARQQHWHYNAKIIRYNAKQFYDFKMLQNPHTAIYALPTHRNWSTSDL